mgnify:CR=1 FL=1
MTDINHGRTHRVADASLVRAPADAVEMRISDADRNGTLRRLHNAVALGLIDIDEFEERSAMVSRHIRSTSRSTLVTRSIGPFLSIWRSPPRWRI